MPDGSGVSTLLQRVRLRATASGLDGPTREPFRLTGVPLLVAALVASGPGWTGHVVQDGDTLGDIARRYGTDPVTLARVNRLANADRVRAGQRLTVPAQRTADGAARRRAAAAGLHPVDSSGAPRLSYRVRPGDTVSGIAARAGVPTRTLLAANHLRPNAIIHPGQRLTLPGLAREAGAATPRRAARRPAARPVVHVVRRGDTVWDLAHKYGVAVPAVLRANRLDRQGTIHPGRKLVLPGARPARPATGRSDPPTVAHVVRRGDTVWAIARRYRTTTATVAKLNHLDLRAVLLPGRRLLVPAPAAKKPEGPPATFLGRRYPDAVVRAAAANRAVLATRSVPDRAATRALVARTARRLGVDPALALAVATMESGFNQRAVSPANAIGTMQVIPSSGEWASQLVGRRLDLLDPEDNVLAGVALLRVLRSRASEPIAIAGYYQGLSSVRRNGMFADTRRYVATVRSLMHRYR